MKLNITWVGTPKSINTKYGPKEKFSIKATEYGENYIDVWSSVSTKDWKVGQQVEVLSVDEGEYNGKKQYTVKMPKADNRPQNGQSPETSKQIAQLVLDNGHIHHKLDAIMKFLKDNIVQRTSAGTPVPDFTPRTMNQSPVSSTFMEVFGDDVNPDDIPF
jgi:hypothetical protein